MRATKDVNGRDPALHTNHGQYTDQSKLYPGSSSAMLPTPGDLGGLGHNSHSSTNVNYPSFQPTLGQMADQFQERARVERKEKISRKRELGEVEDRSGKSSGYSEYENIDGNNNYDDGSDGEGDGGGDNFGYDDGDNEGDGDGDGEGGDDEPGTVPSGHESTGRWTRPEHELFLQALKKYGKVRNLYSIYIFNFSSLFTLFCFCRNGRKWRAW